MKTKMNELLWTLEAGTVLPVSTGYGRKGGRTRKAEEMQSHMKQQGRELDGPREK
ncbi:MAG TPA: hypothetical protein VGJ94_17210 [Syntrophorhabdaceae bacterium]|jgi:hypothetical protein